jgi:tripartite-type tricarboxylate transporter receptor subunit TctC
MSTAFFSSKIARRTTMKKGYFWLLIFLTLSSRVAAQTPYYQGKTIRMMVGYPAGSAHDMWGRLVAPQLTKHIPGNPATVVENRTGAGSMVAANYVYNVAKPDGLTIGVINAALYFDQLMKRPEVQFDWSKYSWVGSSTPTNALLYMWASAPYKTIQDVRSATVTGYQGGADIEIAVERGEVQCRAFSVQVFFGREPFNTWRSKNLVRVLVQTGKKRDARLPETPLFNELMDQYQTAEAYRRLARVLFGSGEFGSAPMIASPGISWEQTKILREAYAKGLNDPDLIAEAKKKGLDPELIHGNDMENLAKEVMVQPPEVIALMKKVME